MMASGMLGGRREKLQALEGKHRSLVQDRSNLQGEKAAMERELKQLRGQASKLTKVPTMPPTESDPHVCPHSLSRKLVVTYADGLEAHAVARQMQCLLFSSRNECMDRCKNASR